MPQTKCAIQQGFPNRPGAGRLTVCLTEREPAAAALHCCLSATVVGCRDFLPAIHIDKVMIVECIDHSLSLEKLKSKSKSSTNFIF